MDYKTTIWSCEEVYPLGCLVRNVRLRNIYLDGLMHQGRNPSQPGPIQRLCLCESLLFFASTLVLAIV